MNKFISLFQKIHRHFSPPKKSPREYTVAQWEADAGDKKLRLTYDLTPEHIVWDVGGFEGQWSSDIFAKYPDQIF